MNKAIIAILILLVQMSHYMIQAQNLTPVILDESFEEWADITDIANLSSSGNQTIKALNDDDFLYLYFEIAEIISIQNVERMVLYIDSDNNASTGDQVNGIGAEITIDFGTRNVTVNLSGTTSIIGLFDLNTVVSPTVWSNKFELAIERATQIDGVNLFSSDEIKLIVEDQTTQILTPSESGGATYTFEANSFDELPSLSIPKADELHVRFMSHNVLRDELFIEGSKESFARMYQAIDPEIIGFQEIYDHTAEEVADLMEEFLPSEAGESWYGSNVHDNILISRFPIKATHTANNNGNGAFLIDLSPKYNVEILVINAHTPCCNNDAGRASEIDAMMAFIRDAKAGTGDLTIKENTPIVIMGDMNLVGNPQDLTTLLNGDIQDENTWGEDFTPDWDGNDFKDAKPITSGLPMTFTWQGASGAGKFSKGRLDVVVYSGSGLTLENAYVLYTNTLSTDMLTQYSLQVGDSEGASDHLPLVTDYTITVELSEEISLLDLRENDSDGIPKLIDETVSVSGIITVDEEFGSNIAYLQDEDAGIAIFSSELGDSFTMGDSVSITAKLGQFNGASQLQYDASSSSVIVHKNTDLPTASLVTIESVIDQDWNGFELIEGKLVRILNVEFTETGNFEGGTNYEISDGVDMLSLRIDANTDLVGTSIPDGTVSITGLINQFDNASPYSEGYQILPRNINDIGASVEGIIALRQNDENGLPIYDGTEVTVSGIITVNEEFGSNLAYLQDNEAGIAIFSTELGDLFTKGDSIDITAILSTFNGSSQLLTSSVNVHKNTEVPEANIVTLEEVLNQEWNGFELIEGTLVQIQNVEFSESGNFTGNTNYEISDGSNVLNLRLNSNTNLVSTAIPSGKISITGILGQFDNSSPYSEGYQILPRNTDDLESSILLIEEISTLRQNDENGLPIHDDALVTVSGVITVSNGFGESGPAFMQDNSAGIAVFGSELVSQLTDGDSITITSQVGEFNGQTQLISSGTNSTIVVHKNVTIPEPKTVTLDEIFDQDWNNFELLEGLLVRVENVEFVESGSFSGNADYTISDGTSSLTIRVDADTEIAGQSIPDEQLNIVGILGQFDNSVPHSEGYQLIPRIIEDLEIESEVTSIGKLNDIGSSIKIFPNPTEDIATIRFGLQKSQKVSITILDLSGRTITPLANKHYEAGKYEVMFDTSNLKAGIYACRLNFESGSLTRKLIVMD